MKKILASLLIVLAAAAVASAQPRALGVRAGWGAEFSYQQYAGGENFWEMDFGWMKNVASAAGTYNFMLGNAGMVNFYAGPGVQVGFYKYQEYQSFAFAVLGQVGAEIEIPSLPINVSLDWRPAIWLGEYSGFSWQGFALGLRYRF